MNRCPNCNKRTISNLSKFNLGPLKSIECPNCRSQISVSWISIFYTFVIFVIMNFVITYFELDMLMSIIWICIVIGVYCLIHIKYMPLRIKK